MTIVRVDPNVRGNARTGTYTVIEVTSDSNPNVIYRVDVTNKRCSCPGWVNHGGRSLCKHLRKLGVKA